MMINTKRIVLTHTRHALNVLLFCVRNSDLFRSVFEEVFPSVSTLNAPQDVLFVYLGSLGHLVNTTGVSRTYIIKPLAEPANAVVISIIRERYKIAGNNWRK